jgi:hypothetical protein
LAAGFRNFIFDQPNIIVRLTRSKLDLVGCFFMKKGALHASPKRLLGNRELLMSVSCALRREDGKIRPPN